MATNKELVDGTLSLTQQEQALNFMEQISFAKVINYTKDPAESSGAKNNEATLDDVPIGQQPDPIHLMIVDAAVNVADAIANHTVVFHEKVFVGGEEKTVLGFR